jgi:hypothetical protein
MPALVAGFRDFAAGSLVDAGAGSSMARVDLWIASLRSQ